MKLLVLLGSVRQSRKGEDIAKWVVEQAKVDQRFKPELVDVKDLELPFYDEPNGGPFAIKGDYKNPKGKAWAEKVASFDAVIIVTAEYNHGYPASLKNALDWVGPEWGGKPVSFVSYGWGGGIRATEQLRQVVAELGLVQTRYATSINLGGELGDGGRPNNERTSRSLAQALDQIAELKK